MKFNYQYRTSGNELRHGSISAPDRDGAYAALVARGIRPSRLVQAPGLLNKVMSSWRAIAVAVLLCAVAAYLLLRGGAGPAVSARHQIYGDPELMEQLEAEAFSSVFADPGERFLACFAQPGDSAARVPETSPEALEATLGRKVEFVEGEAREVRELKEIVAGMKEEFREYLSDGEGTAALFMRHLRERQDEEAAIYRKVAAELEGEVDEVVREAKNSALRAMGLRTVPKPRAKGRQRNERAVQTGKATP